MVVCAGPEGVQRRLRSGREGGRRESLRRRGQFAHVCEGCCPLSAASPVGLGVFRGVGAAPRPIAPFLGGVSALAPKLQRLPSAKQVFPAPKLGCRDTGLAGRSKKQHARREEKRGPTVARPYPRLVITDRLECYPHHFGGGPDTAGATGTCKRVSQLQTPSQRHTNAWQGGLALRLSWRPSAGPPRPARQARRAHSGSPPRRQRTRPAGCPGPDSRKAPTSWLHRGSAPGNARHIPSAPPLRDPADAWSKGTYSLELRARGLCGGTCHLPWGRRCSKQRPAHLPSLCKQVKVPGLGERGSNAKRVRNCLGITRDAFSRKRWDSSFRRPATSAANTHRPLCPPGRKVQSSAHACIAQRLPVRSAAPRVGLPSRKASRHRKGFRRWVAP